MKKILISTGGTGGHVIPAQIIYEHLNDVYDTYISTDKRGLKYLSLNKYKTVIIDTPKLNLSLSFPFRLLKLLHLTLVSFFYLKKEKITRIFSTGGYMSIPVIISAKILGLKIYLLEPNLALGRSNSFFLNFSKKIICYSDKIINFPKKFRSKMELINPLVFKDFYDLEKNENLNKKFHILISGGSQGANFFDEIMKEVIFDLSKIYPIKVIQQTNIQNIKKLEEYYGFNNIEKEIFNFEKNFFNLINKSDLCITRAGATSLAEISIMNKPFVAIPLPSSKDDHQMENAKFYEKNGCCWVLNQKLLNKEKLLDFLIKILDNKSDYIDKKSNLKKLNYKNSWNDVNQKLKKILNEN